MYLQAKSGQLISVDASNLKQLNFVWNAQRQALEDDAAAKWQRQYMVKLEGGKQKCSS